MTEENEEKIPTGLVPIESVDQITFPITEHVAKAELPDSRQHSVGQKVLVKEGRVVLGTVPEHVTVVPHFDVINGVERILGEQKLEFQRKLMADAAGTRMMVTYTIPSIEKDIRPDEPGGDKTCLELHVSNNMLRSYTGLEAGGLRLVCANGMVAWGADHKFRRKPAEPLQVEQIGEAIMQGIQAFEDKMVPKWQEMSSETMTFDSAQRFLGMLNLPQVYFEQAIEELDKIKEQVLTMWLVYNIVTFLATHRASSLEKGRQIHAKVIGEINRKGYCYHGDKPHRICKAPMKNVTPKTEAPETE